MSIGFCKRLIPGAFDFPYWPDRAVSTPLSTPIHMTSPANKRSNLGRLDRCLFFSNFAKGILFVLLILLEVVDWNAQ